jgi:hypothetical protein
MRSFACVFTTTCRPRLVRIGFFAAAGVMASLAGFAMAAAVASAPPTFSTGSTLRSQPSNLSTIVAGAADGFAATTRVQFGR